METITRTPNRLFTNFKPDDDIRLAIDNFHFLVYSETISLPRFVTRMLACSDHVKTKFLARHLLKVSLVKNETAPHYLVAEDIERW